MPPPTRYPVPKALDLNVITPQIALWHAYDPGSKTELFSTALSRSQGLLLVDPIDLALAAERELLQLGRPSAVAITNENHGRAAASWAAKFQIRIFGPGAPPQESARSILTLPDAFPDLVVIEIRGGPEGEIALFSPDNGGTLILGDGLIHFEPYGLALLPKKYCQSQKEMRISLQQLLERPFERVFFAHGMPILRNAFDRVRSLLTE